MSAFDSGWGSGGLFGSTPPEGAPDLSQRKTVPVRRPASFSRGGSGELRNPSQRRQVSVRPSGQGRRPDSARSYQPPRLDTFDNDFGNSPEDEFMDEWSSFSDSRSRPPMRDDDAPASFDGGFDDRMYAPRSGSRPHIGMGGADINPVFDDFDGFDDDFNSSPPPSGRFRQDRRGQDMGQGQYRGHNDEPPMPKIFADYFRGESGGKAMSQQNLRDSAKARKSRRIKSIVGITTAVAVVAAAIGTYITMFVSFNPYEMSAPFESISNDTVYALLSPTVNRKLRETRVTLMVEGGAVSGSDAAAEQKDGANNTQKDNVSSSDVSDADVSGSDSAAGPGFTLAEFDFHLASSGDPARKIIDVTGEDGKITSQIIVKRNSLAYNETLVKQYLAGIAGERGGTPMVEPYHEIVDGELIVHEGTDGFGVYYDVFVERLFSAIKSDSSSISVKMENVTAPAINPDTLYEEVHRVVSDASFSTNPDGSKNYTPDVVGVDFDLEKARGILSSGKSPWTIPLKITQPAVTLKQLRADECPDLLAEYSTKFDTGNAARTNNLTLAAKAISGKKLEPREQISFNDTVGERTEARGYAKATTYSESGTQEDYGGGICQVSSTLYYTFIKANLKVIERRNHRYTVHYMPYGNDATVDWGHIDLKLENDKEYPIRIEFIIKGGVITCQVWGTADGYSAKLGYTEVPGSMKTAGIKYRKQTSPPTKNVAGQIGITVSVWRIVYKDEVEVSRKQESVDTYQPLDNIRYVSEKDLPAGEKFEK